LDAAARRRAGRFAGGVGHRHAVGPRNLDDPRRGFAPQIEPAARLYGIAKFKVGAGHFGGRPGRAVADADRAEHAIGNPGHGRQHERGFKCPGTKLHGRHHLVVVFLIAADHADKKCRRRVETSSSRKKVCGENRPVGIRGRGSFFLESSRAGDGYLVNVSR
jgi:hypothetical protein